MITLTRAQLNHLQSQVGDEGKNYWALLLVTLSVCMVSGNVLVIMSVVKERALQNMTNYFIVSLASADLLVAGLVMPFTIYALVNWGLWGLPKLVCDFYISLDVICSTSSIFNLVAISIDRFLAVTQPIKYSQHKDKKERAYIVIFICWLASIGIGTPIMFGANPIPEIEIDSSNSTNSSISSHDPDVSNSGRANYNETLETNRMKYLSSVGIFSTSPTLKLELMNSTTTNNLQHEAASSISTTENDFVCAFYNPEYIIYSSLCSFFIPCVFMVFLYSRIFWEIRKRAQKANKKKKPVAQPKANGTKPLVTPSSQIHAINEVGPKVSGHSNAFPSHSPKSTPMAENKNHILTRVQNHTSNGENKLCVNDEKLNAIDDAKGASYSSLNEEDNSSTNVNMEMKPLILTQIIKASTEEDTSGPISPPPLKPNMAHKACGPNTSLYERARSKSNGKRKVNLPDENKVLPSSSQTVPSIILTSCNQTGDKTVSTTIKRPVEAEVRNDQSSSSNGEQQITVAAEDSNNHRNGKNDTIVKSLSSVFHVGKKQPQNKTKKEEKIKRKKDKSAAKKERKATKTLAIVLGCFLVCWIPFFTCNIMNAICIKYQLGWEPGETAFLITTFIGYINSCLNPVIYTIFNPEFRKAFKKILGLGH